MPYDLFVNRHPTGGEYEWAWCRTYAKLHEAQDAITYHGYTQPELRRWSLFYVHRTTAKKSILHSQGDYPKKEE